jgi:hypothetical protein
MFKALMTRTSPHTAFGRILVRQRENMLQVFRFAGARGQREPKRTKFTKTPMLIHVLARSALKSPAEASWSHERRVRCLKQLFVVMILASNFSDACILSRGIARHSAGGRYCSTSIYLNKYQSRCCKPRRAHHSAAYLAVASAHAWGWSVFRLAGMDFW